MASDRATPRRSMRNHSGKFFSTEEERRTTVSTQRAVPPEQSGRYKTSVVSVVLRSSFALK